MKTKSVTLSLILTLLFTLCSITACWEPSVWQSYFVFDNVTIVQTQEIKYVENGVEKDMSDISPATFTIADGKWQRHKEQTRYVDGVPTNEPETIYYDGENRYVNGKLDESNDGPKAIIPNISVIENFQYDEGAFQETSEGVFVAATLDSYKDVTITVVEGKIQSVTMIYQYTSSGVTYTSHQSYAFSNWGTTVIETAQ